MLKKLSGILLIVLGVASIKLSFNYYKYLIPKNVIEDLKKNGWNYYIVKDLNHPLGYTDSSDKLILAKDYSVLLHELGHYIDIRCNYLSNENEFIQIYNKTKSDSKFNDYHISTKEEYFAEMYKQMLIKPNIKNVAINYINKKIKECYKYI